MSNSTSNRAFDRVLIIMFENMYRSYVMKNEYMRGLARQGIDMANYFGAMHPSQTNYIASIAGELCNVSNDDRPTPLAQQTIVDLLEAKGLDWRAYMDGYPSAQNTWKKGLVPQDDFPYVIKHNPFSSFENILNNEARWNKIVDQDQFFRDAASGNLPEYAWFTPNMWHDGHYSVGTTVDPDERAPALVDQQATWLQYFFGMLKFPGPESLIPPGTLVVVTYDESDFESKIDEGDKYTYDGPNQIYTVLLGRGMGPTIGNRVEKEGYNHYSLIRTIEENFQLGSLEKNDRQANYFQFLWGREFAWQAPTPIPACEILTKEVLAIAEFKGERFLAHRAVEPKLHLRRQGLRQGKGVWTHPEALKDTVANHAVFAQVNDTLRLLFSTPGGIEQLHLYADGSWVNDGEHVVIGEVKSFAVVAFDEGRCLMLVWSDAEGYLYSLVHSQGKWAAEVMTVGGQNSPGFRTTGEICLGRIGNSLVCIFEAAHRRGLMVVDYNTAPFNVVSVPEGKYAGPYDDTTLNQWSPSSFPVSEYLHAPSPITPGEDEPIAKKFPGCAPLACATLDGVLHLVHARPNLDSDCVDLVTETLSVAGLLTPRLPVSYAAGDQKTTSNGYGTLAEAGWSDQRVLAQANRGAKGGMAMCETEAGLWLVYAGADGELWSLEGSYDEQAACGTEDSELDQTKMSLRSVS